MNYAPPTLSPICVHCRTPPLPQLFAQVEALQIQQVELPSSFQDALLESISTKQNITRSERYKDNMQVTFQTQRMVAEQTRMKSSKHLDESSQPLG